MNTLINKTVSAVSGVVLFAAGCIMAGLGFAVVAVLALFALLAVAVAVLASPFLVFAQPAVEETPDVEVTA